MGARTVDIQEDRFTMHYAVVSHHSDRIAAEGDGVVVIYNYREGSKTFLPEEIRKKILDLERA